MIRAKLIAQSASFLIFKKSRNMIRKNDNSWEMFELPTLRILNSAMITTTCLPTNNFFIENMSKLSIFVVTRSRFSLSDG